MNLGGKESHPHYTFARSLVSDVAFKAFKSASLCFTEIISVGLVVVTGGPGMLSQRMFVFILYI